jgi:AraC-like DNA-binding protein
LYSADLKRTWPNVCRYYAMNHAYYEMELHVHPELEIMYAAEGGCSVFVAESPEGCREVMLREGEYIFLDSLVPHRLAVKRESPCRVLNLEIALAPDEGGLSLEMLRASASFEKLLRSRASYFTGVDLQGSLHQMIVSLQKLLYGSADELECRFQTGLFLLELANQYARRKKTAGELVYVKQALAFLQENFDHEIAVADVAAAAGTSKAHLQRLFKAETGCSIVDYILTLRINKAKYLLETSTLPVVDVAIGVGFNSRQHFSQTFNRLVGCSPALYRKRKGNLRLWEGFERP